MKYVMARTIIPEIAFAAFMAVTTVMWCCERTAAADSVIDTVVKPANVPDGSFVRITRDGGVSPFVKVYYDVTVRGGTVVVTMVKETICRTGQRERVRLLDGAAASSLLAGLDELNAWSPEMPRQAAKGRAADSQPDSARFRWEFWGSKGGAMYRFFASQETVDSNPALVRLVSGVRRAVRSLVEPLPLRDVFHPADQTGYLAMTASEPSVAVIDGWDRIRLPVTSLDLKVGVHDVVVTGRSGATRSFSVRIVAGETAVVHVLLGDGTDPAR